jgi:hypothetical protein
MQIKISEVEETFKKILEDAKVQSVDSVYEVPEDADFHKLVISMHEVSMGDVGIIHTKFIFKVNTERTELLENSFIYLYDLNCNYHKVNFKDISQLENKIKDILESNDFGDDINILSDFLEAPAMFLSYYMKRAGITEYSIFDVKYSPKFKHVPCNEITFDFKVSVNNSYNIDVSIKKIDIADEAPSYKFTFKFLDNIETIDTDTLTNIHFRIGSGIADTLDKYL